MGLPYAEVIGDPIAHSKSPLIHNFWLAERGISGRYQATRVGRGDLDAYFGSRRGDPDWLGCNVTMPLKEAVLDHVDFLHVDAECIGAVNTVVRTPGGLMGVNTDAAAILDAIREETQTSEILQIPVVVIGAGGAARAALYALSRTAAVEVIVMNRTQAKAAALLSEFGIAGKVRPLEGRLPRTNLLINASCLGMTGCPDWNLDLEPLAGTVVELVYNPVETSLVRTARSCGLEVIDGIDILIAQAAYAFAYFFDPIDQPRFGVGREVRELLTR